MNHTVTHNSTPLLSLLAELAVGQKDFLPKNNENIAVWQQRAKTYLVSLGNMHGVDLCVTLKPFTSAGTKACDVIIETGGHAGFAQVTLA